MTTWLSTPAYEHGAAVTADLATALRALEARKALLAAVVAALAAPDDHAAGLSNKEIAGRLRMSPRTVGAHLYRVFPKLGIGSRAALRDALSRRAVQPGCRGSAAAG